MRLARVTMIGRTAPAVALTASTTMRPVVGLTAPRNFSTTFVTGLTLFAS